MWDNWEIMFPTNIAHSDDYEWIAKPFAIDNKINEITATFIKPARNSTETIIKYHWKSDGSFSQDYIYTPYNENLPDGISLLNVYGSKIAKRINEN